MTKTGNEIWLARHGETEWSITGQHTGRTDIPLTPHGEEQAAALGRMLGDRQFARVLTSPLQRARRTCEIAGYGSVAEDHEGLLEWDYGELDGKTTVEMVEERPGWNLWQDGPPAGETLQSATARVQAVIEECLAASGPSLLFAHGHILRILGACWIEMPPEHAQRLYLSTASLSVLGWERSTRVISTWNCT